ncbi:hypothetical protein [Actinomadura rupiterrae]|uniref:hypothetical protein n=1 Tax=Actinomadura rupiterrae TaxID=559627 RepID=UPI0020A419C8|nr:hypothetical protein [Actinomadura rupiterrae]MCP2341997.1 hypothetical protein [Actinomadura rupiterrae]
MPLTVWLCSDSSTGETAATSEPNRAARGELCEEHRQEVGRQLARHLINTCTESDDVVVEAFTASDAVLGAAAELGRRGVALVPHFPLAQYIGSRLRATYDKDTLARVAMRPVRPDQITRGLADHSRDIALVIAAPPPYEVGGRRPKVVGQHGCPACRADVWMLERQQLTEFLKGAWQVLKPGGVLAIVTSARHQDDGGLHDPAPQVIAQASRMGFVYAQHVIALRVPIEGDALAVQLTPTEVGQLRNIGSVAPSLRARVHADVCLFVKPRAQCSLGSDKGSRR